MTIRNLEFAAHPKSVAIIGASTRAGSVGNVVTRNIVEGGFEGEIWPVNPKYKAVENRRCYPGAADLPAAPDLAVIMTPAKTVPGLIRELGKKGCRAAVVISAGITQKNGLKRAMLDAAEPFLFRIIGPNTIGLILPAIKLNASFAHMGAAPGGLALLSQSGAIATSMLDWAADQNIGFSQIVSLGDMADVDVGDYLDMLAGDRHTLAILMYLETIPNPRKFMSAARAASRLKPVIAIKSGRHEQAAQAAMTHTGSLAGLDQVADAALRRAGILRVSDIGEIFDAAETLARFPPITNSRVGIVTNGGGAGVLAVDRLIDLDGELAQLSQATLKRLDQTMPSNWSRANPVDIIGDAPPERFTEAVLAVAEDPATDALIVLNCPTGLADATDSAGAVAALAEKGRVRGKPVLACWLGEKTARQGRKILQDAGIADFVTPGDAARALSYLSRWSIAQSQLMRVPSSRSEDIKGDRDAVTDILRQVAEEKRLILTEPEAKAVLGAYGIPVPRQAAVASSEAVFDAAKSLLQPGGRIVVKLLSKTLTHKSDVGGVVLNIKSPAAARGAAIAIEGRLRSLSRAGELDGFVVQEMVVRGHAQELLAGIARDPIFGPVIVFGAGGTAVEVVADTAMMLPPLDNVLAGDLIDCTRIGKLLKGYRDREPADRPAIAKTLNAISQLVIDFPCISAMDINPLLADKDGVVALDARIEIDPGRIGETGPNSDLAIRPYPADATRDMVLDGMKFHIRPIKPADIALYDEFRKNLSDQDVRFRFFAPRRNFSDKMLQRLTQLDYEREMAFIALRVEDGALAGIGRWFSDPDKETAEFALLVRTDMQGRGLGWALLTQLVDYARSEGIGRIEGQVLDENAKMLQLCREFGFDIRAHPSEHGLRNVSLDLQ
jgi:acetyltransferase